MIDFSKVNTNRFFAERKIAPCPYCHEEGIIKFRSVQNKLGYSIVAYCTKCGSHTRDDIGDTEYEEYLNVSPYLTSQISGIKASQKDIVLLERAVRDWQDGFIKQGDYCKKR